MAQRTQVGASLIEVLVAMLLMSLTLLLVAGLHTRALQFNTSASLNSQMNIKAADLLERMRLNAGALNHYQLSLASVSDAVQTRTSHEARAHAPYQDLTQWLSEVAALAPEARVQVACDAARRCEVEIHWQFQIGKGELAAADTANRVVLYTKI